MSAIGIIGGSGLYELEALSNLKTRTVSTPYGEPSSDYRVGTVEATDVVFLPRHGVPHTIAPHKINYRANLWGLKELGVTQIISITAAGGINQSLKPGEIVITDQIIDQCQGARASTFYDGDEVVHVDFTEPYCPVLRRTLIKSAEAAEIVPTPSGTYVCVNGPRLESAAEIKHFALMGADVVGMTAMPEAALARELAICYGGISIVTNYAAGITNAKLTTDEVVSTMKGSYRKIEKILLNALKLIPAERSCDCKDALKGTKI